MIRFTVALTLAFGLGVPLTAADGILVVQRITSGTSTQTAQMQLEKSRMRTEIADRSGALQIVIFDGTKQVMTLIDMQRKTYTEITKAQVDEISAQMQGMMAQMQQQLASMPPEQRAQVEAMMSGRGMAAAMPVKTEYKRNGTDRVGRWTCDKYDGFQNGQKTSEICTVAPSALGVGASDFDVTRQMATFFAAIVPQMASQVAAVGKMEEQGFSGFPIKTVSTVGDRQTTSELTEVKRDTFADSVFAVPAGFRKEDFMGGGRRGRGGDPR